ncbi:mate-domain-containing protein [Phlebopus sp. FC_14]|nr:mate-domain-containing protein [Phlebopus sp. FC_14]
MFLEECIVLVKYTLPVFGTHVFEHSMVLTSVVSIGHLSTVSLAAATIGFMTANVTGFSIIQGLASTLDTVLPSAWTSDQPNLVGLWTQRMLILTTLSLIPVFVVWFNAESLLLLLKQDAAVAKLAAIYLRWISLGLPAYAFECISRRYFQSQGLFTVPTRIILAVAPVNILLNYLLVWGPAPLRLGFIGAPIATSISYNLIAIAALVYGVFYVDRTAWHPLSRKSLTSLGLLAKLSVGSIGQVVTEWWSWELVGCTDISSLGPVPLATQSILLSTVSTCFQAPYSLGIASSVRIGNLLGEMNHKRAGVAANASIILSLVLALIFSGILVVFRHSWGYLFNDDPEVVALVGSTLPLIALVELFDCTNGVVSGILRARGKQLLGAVLNISGYYFIGLPIGLWLAFQRDMQLAGLWWGINAATFYSSSVGAYLCVATDWKKEVEKVMARLAIDKVGGGSGETDEEGTLRGSVGGDLVSQGLSA